MISETPIMRINYPLAQTASLSICAPSKDVLYIYVVILLQIYFVLIHLDILFDLTPLWFLHRNWKYYIFNQIWPQMPVVSRRWTNHCSSTGLDLDEECHISIDFKTDHTRVCNVTPAYVLKHRQQWLNITYHNHWNRYNIELDFLPLDQMQFVV